MVSTGIYSSSDSSSFQLLVVLGIPQLVVTSLQYLNLGSCIFVSNIYVKLLSVFYL
jgi:hypothetical protein